VALVALVLFFLYFNAAYLPPLHQAVFPVSDLAFWVVTGLAWASVYGLAVSRVWRAPRCTIGRLLVCPAGVGLVSMRERAEVLGGRFAAGATEEGGFRVDATLPYAPAA
jgi:hypothetical protein